MNNRYGEMSDHRLIHGAINEDSPELILGLRDHDVLP